MNIIRNATGDIIRRSKNLRGMIEHARRTSPVSATFGLATFNDMTVLTVTYANGDTACSVYAQADIAGRFLNSRRSWPRLAVSGDPAFIAAYDSGRRL